MPTGQFDKLFLSFNAFIYTVVKEIKRTELPFQTSKSLLNGFKHIAVQGHQTVLNKPFMKKIPEFSCLMEIPEYFSTKIHRRKNKFSPVFDLSW